MWIKQTKMCKSKPQLAPSRWSESRGMKNILMIFTVSFKGCKYRSEMSSVVLCDVVRCIVRFVLCIFAYARLCMWLIV